MDEQGGSSKEIWFKAAFIEDEGGFGGRVLLVKGDAQVVLHLSCRAIELNNLNPLRVAVEEGSDRAL